MRDEDKTVLGCLGIVAYFILVIPLAAILRGFALVKLWAWFVVVPFGLRPLNIPLAYGLSCIISLPSGRYHKQTSSDTAITGGRNRFRQ